MLELLAIAPEDGWAFVRDSGRVRLVRPPYTQTNITPVEESSVETAVQRHGFQAEGRAFATWPELVTFLNGQVRASRAAQGEALAAEGAGAELLRMAPPDVLERLLRRIEAELIPSGQWQVAEKLLSDMLDLRAVQRDCELLVRVSTLFRRVHQEHEAVRESRQALVEGAANIPARFPRVERQYGAGVFDFMRRTASPGRIFAMR